MPKPSINSDAAIALVKRAQASGRPTWWLVLYAAAIDDLGPVEAADFADDASQNEPPNDDASQFAFDESKHPRGADGRFGTGSGSSSDKSGDDASSSDDAVETPELTAPGATAPATKSSLAGGAVKAARGVWAVINAGPAIANQIIKATGAPPAVAKVAMAIATALDWGVPGIPAGSIASIVITSAISPKAPIKAARAAVAAWKEKRAKRRNQREALASLTAEHAPRAAASAAPATQYADTKRNIIWRDAYRDDVSDGMWRVPGVPVFCVVPSGTKARPDGSYDDDDGVDRSTLERMAAHANQRAKVGHYRALHLGHQKNHPDGRPDLSGDQPLLAFCENWRVEDTSWGPVLHCDLWGIEERDIEQFERGRYPFLSVEAGADEVVSIAVMQSRPPHFEFPNLWIRRHGKASAPAAARHAADTRLARQFAADYRKQHAQEARMDEKDDKLPPVPFADDGDDKDDDKDEADQYAAPPGAAPGAPAAAPAAAPEPTMNDVMALLKQIAASLKTAAPAAPAAPAPVQHASVPDTMRPLEPASASKFALDPADRAALDTVRQYAAQIAHDKAKKSVIAEARGSASRDELAVLEGMADKSPEVARQFASYLRTRGPVQTGPATVTAVSVPVSIIGAAIKQFAADTGRQVDEHDQRALAIAQQARTDWLDTTRDEGPDGKVFRQQFAGEAGCRKWIALNLARALPKRIG